MAKEKITRVIETILIRYFSISEKDFDWTTPLEVLSEDFKFLSALVRLEKHINQELNASLQLIHQLSAAFHTPKDLVEIVHQAIHD